MKRPDPYLNKQQRPSPKATWDDKTTWITILLWSSCSSRPQRRTANVLIWFLPRLILFIDTVVSLDTKGKGFLSTMQISHFHAMLMALSWCLCLEGYYLVKSSCEVQYCIYSQWVASNGRLARRRNGLGYLKCAYTKHSMVCLRWY